MLNFRRVLPLVPLAPESIAETISRRTGLLPDWNVRIRIGLRFLELVQFKLERVDLIYIPWYAENALRTSTIKCQHLKNIVKLNKYRIA